MRNKLYWHEWHIIVLDISVSWYCRFQFSSVLTLRSWISVLMAMTWVSKAFHATKWGDIKAVFVFALKFPVLMACIWITQFWVLRHTCYDWEWGGKGKAPGSANGEVKRSILIKTTGKHEVKNRQGSEYQFIKSRGDPKSDIVIVRHRTRSKPGSQEYIEHAKNQN